MAPTTGLAIALFAWSGTALAQAAPRTVQPGAPGEASRVRPPAEVGRGESRHTQADVQFMQGMIPHHAQALEMTSLVPTRSSREDVLLLAQRIEAAQDYEISVMRRWLRERGEAAPDAAGHHGHDAEHHALMPGMLTEEEMARLAAATGAEFDRLFLEYMIRHHEGALIMVAELFASAGAGQEWEIFQFASGVDGDQRIEIARMYRMLAEDR